MRVDDSPEFAMVCGVAELVSRMALGLARAGMTPFRPYPTFLDWVADGCPLIVVVERPDGSREEIVMKDPTMTPVQLAAAQLQRRYRWVECHVDAAGLVSYREARGDTWQTPLRMVAGQIAIKWAESLRETEREAA